MSTRLERSSITQEMLIESLAHHPPIFVPGTAIFMTSSRGRTPVALLHNLKHNGTIHERVIFLTIIFEDEPWVSPGSSVEIAGIGPGFWQVTGRYGYMQRPNVPRLLRLCGSKGLEVSAEKSTFFMGREVIAPGKRPGKASGGGHSF